MKQFTAALLLFIISATAGVTRELSYSCSLPPLAFKFYQMGDGNLYDIEVIRGTAVDLFSAVEAGVPQLYDAQSTVHFEQRGAARSPTTLTMSMLQARTRPLLACRNHPCSPNLGRCHRASPD